MHPSRRHRKPSTFITHDHHTMTIHRTRSPHDCHLTFIYTFLYETGNARCRAHHFPGARQTWQPPRRCGISPYNTSHITTTRPKSLTICKMTNPKRDAMSRTPHQLLLWPPKALVEMYLRARHQYASSDNITMLVSVKHARYQQNSQINHHDSLPAPNGRGSPS
jgi:hypothetical protein